MKITSLEYHEHTADALINLVFANGFPACIHACYSDEAHDQENFDHKLNRRNILIHSNKLGKWIEPSLSGIYEKIATRFLKVKNAGLPDAEKLSKAEFMREICLALIYTTLDGTLVLYFTTGNLFEEKLLAADFDTDFNMVYADLY